MAFYGHGKSKHFRHRNLDIPEWKVKDFLIKDPKIMTEFSTKRWVLELSLQEDFGDEDVGSIMAGMEMSIK